MHLELKQLRAAHPDEPNETYEEEFHDVNAILMDICVALGDTNAFEFRVSGFGQEKWPVDVATDLATVLEQLPQALAACTGNQEFEIDFFEQGVQRRLSFVPSRFGYQVSCFSSTDWVPVPDMEPMNRDTLCSMLRELGRTFVSIACTCLPRTASHPWLLEYASAVSNGC